jgi:hypothetical protein
VATNAFDSFDDDMPKSPLVRHPAFPAIVATWFATLLGLGTLVLPAVLLERLVGATGLAALFPAAAPPLGATARALIAVVAALAGAVAGWAIARRVANTPETAEEPRRARYPSGIRRPINVRDEFGDDVMFEDFGLPVPGQGTRIPEDRDLANDLGEAPSPERPAEEEEEAVDPSRPVPHWPGEAEPAAPDAAEPFASGDIGEPLAFAAPSLLRRPEPTRDGAAPAGDAPQQPAPLDGLGLVDLAERLRSSIERRREWIAGSAVAAPPPATAGIEAAPAEEAAQAIAAYFGRPTAIGGSAAASPAQRNGEADLGALAASAPPGAGAAVADPVETDAALRAALVNLQRVSGRA